MEAFPPILWSMNSLDFPATLVPIATALGCGLLIGIERERRKAQSEAAAFAGMRTFALVAMLGALAHSMGLLWLEVCGGLLIVALIGIAYARSESTDVGITTEIALFTTYAIGIAAAIDPAFAALIAVVVMVILLTRTRLHRFATETLTPHEVRDGTLLLATALIVLPLAPDREIAGLAGINPHRIGVVAVTLMVIQTAAHIALRTAGERIGGALSGFLSGFVSSTATFAAMAARARESPGSVATLAGGTLLSHVASRIQLAAVVALLNPALLARLALSLGLGAAALLATSAWMLHRSPVANPAREVQAKQMFNPVATFAFVALLSLFTLLVNWAHGALGAQATFVTATIAALIDLHAAAAAALSPGATLGASLDELRAVLLLMLTVNVASKAVISVGGGRAFCTPTIAALSAALLLCWLPQLSSGW